MNKKIKTLIVLFVLVALIPIGYKQYLDKTLIAKINDLNNQGFMVTKIKDDSSLLTTAQSYKVVISNPDSIYDHYLKNIFDASQKELAKKALSTLNDSEFTIDLNILNFPVSHKDALSIYLTSLPPKAVSSSKSNTIVKEIELFLKNKGLGEIVDTNAFGKATSMRMKNIDKKFDAKKGSLEIVLKDYIVNLSRFDLKNYNYAFKTLNKRFKIQIEAKDKTNIDLQYNNLKCNTDRKNLYNYDTYCNVDDLNFLLSQYGKDINLKLNDIFVSSKSALMAENISYKFRYKIKEIALHQTLRYGRKLDLKIDNFLYSGTLSGLSKDTMEQISKLSYDKNSLLKKEYLDIIQKVLNKGLTLKIDNLSIDSLVVNAGKKPIAFGQIKTSLTINLEKNSIDLSRKRVNPLTLIRYIDIEAKISLDKKDYEFLKSFDRRGKIDNIVKFQGNKAIFDIEFNKGKLTINGQKP